MEDTKFVSDVKLLTGSLGQLPEPVVKPAFLVVSGLPGTGKSYFPNKLAERLPILVLESDALRKILFSSPSYTPHESSRLFKAIHALIKKLLGKGISVILDATNLSERYREHLYSIADHLGSNLILVRVEAPPELVRKRLNLRRDDGGNKADADWETYQKMRPSVQRMWRGHYVVDTSEDVSSVLDKIVCEVRC